MLDDIVVDLKSYSVNIFQENLPAPYIKSLKYSENGKFITENIDNQRVAHCGNNRNEGGCTVIQNFKIGK